MDVGTPVDTAMLRQRDRLNWGAAGEGQCAQCGAVEAKARGGFRFRVEEAAVSAFAG
jgi:hypothetical protein